MMFSVVSIAVLRINALLESPILDHTVELQLLNSVMKTSGVCGVLTALEAADATKAKSTILNDAAQHISAIDNLIFLDSKINNQVTPLLYQW